MFSKVFPAVNVSAQMEGIPGTVPNHRIREAVKGEGILVEGHPEIRRVGGAEAT